MGDSFTHLHVHTEYSMLDGAARIGEVVAAAAQDGQPALGITDHGNMYGILDFYKECRNQGIKPILGSELYMAHESRHERPSRRGRLDDGGGEAEGGQKLYYHLTALAETNEGYQNLIKLSSEAYLSGFHYKPKCLLPGQEIVTAEGMKPVEDVAVGDLVLTHRGRLRRVTRVMTREHSGPIHGIELNNRYGRVTWMTPEHPVLVGDQSGERRWVQVQDIEAGRARRTESMSSWKSFACLPKVRAEEDLARIRIEDYIGPEWQWDGARFVKESTRERYGTTRHYCELENEVVLDFDLGFFIGLFAAEGHTSGAELAFSLHQDETWLIEPVCRMIKRLTGKEATVGGRGDRPGYKGVQVRVCSSPLAAFLRRVCGSGANNKHLPDFAFQANEEFQFGLLDGVFAGDGSQRGPGIIFTQTSRQLAWQVRALAATHFDTFASIREYDDGDPRHATQYRMNITIPWRIKHHRLVRSDDDYVYRPIARLHTKHYDGPVYNFEVEDDHSYVSDFAIHNCDFELLEQHSKGLIVTSGCLGGHVLQALMRDDVEGARKAAGRLQDIFGRDSFFMEMQDHGIPEQQRTNPMLLDLAKHLQAPLLATNDSHYVHRHDSVAHDALLCVQTGSQMSDPDRFKFHGDEHYLKPAHEMRYLFEEIPEACDNTLWIAERADVTIEFGKPQLPNFPLPEGFESDGDYLKHLCMEGAQRRWGSALDDRIVERLHYELGVIESMGFSSYFLIVWDLIKHARDNGIRVGPGRGSAAGCAVAYTLWITDLDPIKYDLLFERFLNPSRVSMPDIDMDFDSRYRDEMIRYAAEKYGRDHVAQIVTFSTIKARAAVRDAARVLGYPYGLGDKVAKAMPPLIMGRDTPLYACLEKTPKYEDGYKMAADLRRMREEDEDAAKVIEVAKGLEGLRRQDGIHAAAVVITKEPLTTYLPIQRKPEGGKPAEDSPIVTQYEMHGVEELGLLKMDFLGLRNLDVISDTVEIIRETRGVELDIDAVPLDDEPTYEMLRRGEGIGIFQLEGGPMRALMRSLAPTSFEDICALLALYRPGPMAANMHNDYADRKNGRKPVEHLHDDAEEVLGDTYGLMIYQESLLRVAQKFAGFSLADADLLRRACLPAGTKVLTRARGYVPIEKVMSLRDRRVQTIDTTSATSRHEAVDDVWPVGRKPVYRLTTASGYSIEATAEHPFLVEDRWTPLGEITPGDLVAVAAHTHTHGGTTISDAEIVLSALLISEGYTPDPASGRGGHFTNKDPELLEAFRIAYHSYFGRPHTRASVSNGVTALRLTVAEMRQLGPVLGSYGLAADKTIPPVVLNASTRKVEMFLGLYFAGDGYSDRMGMHYASKSLAVCRGLKRMLLRLGVLSNIRHRDIEGHGRHYVVSIADNTQIKALMAAIDPYLPQAKFEKMVRWSLGWTDRSSATNIGIPMRFVMAELERRRAVTGRSKRALGVDSGSYAKTRLTHRSSLQGLLYSERLEDLRTGDLVWDTVRTIEPAGEKECFDFRMANEDRPYAVIEDFLVHNCGKKKRDLIAKEREKFIAGCVDTGYGAELGGKYFDIIEPFADYAFAKSHAYGYGYIAYQTAYLKANYPAEYLSALLTSVKASLEKAAVYLAECRTMGIQVLVPDVNRSVADFAPVVEIDADTGTETRSIVFGLSAVRNVGSGLVGLLIAEREANGPFADFYDFVERVDFQVLNKKTIESLIKAGAFDSMGHPRQGLLRSFEHIIDTTVARRRERDMGVMSLFGEIEEAGPMFDERPPIPSVEFAKRERLSFEKEMLGLYVSDHPLMGAEASLRRRCDGRLSDLPEMDDGTIRTFGGVVTNLQRKWTKKGDLMAVFQLEDLQTAVEVMVFPKSMTEHGHKLVDDGIVTVRARVDAREDTPKLIAMELEPFEPMSGEAFPLRVKVAPTALSELLIADLKRLLGEHPGDSPVLLHLGESKVLRLPEAWTVDVGPGLLGELRVLLGPTAILA